MHRYHQRTSPPDVTVIIKVIESLGFTHLDGNAMSMISHLCFHEAEQ